MLTIDIETARRFILGKQGLWPGRRWRGIKGTEQAMRAIEYLQLDPLQIIARSHDITLHSRVLDYKPDMWETVTYKKRKFFDWGGWLAARPMDELPHWRTVMHRERDGNYGDSRIRLMAREHADAIAEMRVILQERGIVSNRDFETAARTRTQCVRARRSCPSSSVRCLCTVTTGSSDTASCRCVHALCRCRCDSPETRRSYRPRRRYRSSRRPPRRAPPPPGRRRSPARRGAIDNPENVKVRRDAVGIFKSWGCDAYGDDVYVHVVDEEGNLSRHSPCFDFPTVADRDIDWAFYAPEAYQAGYIWSAYTSIKNVFHNEEMWNAHIWPVDELLADIRAEALPPVTWIVPRYQLSDHPPFSTCFAQNWETDIVNGIMESSMWNHTAIFITWDEWGSFYHHVEPPQADRLGRGFRVPMLVVSPYARRGYVDDALGEFTTPLRFIADVHERLEGALEAAAGDVREVVVRPPLERQPKLEVRSRGRVGLGKHVQEDGLPLGRQEGRQMVENPLRICRPVERD